MYIDKDTMSEIKIVEQKAYDYGYRTGDEAEKLVAKNKVELDKTITIIKLQNINHLSDEDFVMPSGERFDLPNINSLPRCSYTYSEEMLARERFNDKATEIYGVDGEYSKVKLSESQFNELESLRVEIPYLRCGGAMKRSYASYVEYFEEHWRIASNPEDTTGDPYAGGSQFTFWDLYYN